MSTASVPALPAVANLAAVRRHAKLVFGFAILFDGVATAGIFLAAFGVFWGRPLLVGLPVSVVFWFFGIGFNQVHAVLKSQDERLARLEELMDRRSA